MGPLVNPKCCMMCWDIQISIKRSPHVGFFQYPHTDVHMLRSCQKDFYVKQLFLKIFVSCDRRLYRSCFMCIIESVLIQRQCSEGLNDFKTVQLFAHYDDFFVSQEHEGRKWQQNQNKNVISNICIGPEFHHRCIVRKVTWLVVTFDLELHLQQGMSVFTVSIILLFPVIVSHLHPLISGWMTPGWNVTGRCVSVWGRQWLSSVVCILNRSQWSRAEVMIWHHTLSTTGWLSVICWQEEEVPFVEIAHFSFLHF